MLKFKEKGGTKKKKKKEKTLVNKRAKLQKEAKYFKVSQMQMKHCLKAALFVYWDVNLILYVCSSWV